MTRLELVFAPADGAMRLTSICGRRRKPRRGEISIDIESGDDDLAMKALDAVDDAVRRIDIMRPYDWNIARDIISTSWKETGSRK